MPWVVKECGWRGAIGAGKAGFLVVDWVKRSSFSSRSVGANIYIGSKARIARRLPMAAPGCWRSRCMVRLYRLRETRPDAVQFLAVHFCVPAGRPDRLFCAWPPQQCGGGDLAGAGLAGLLFVQQLA